ncbi:GLYCOSIDASE CRH2-RELATED [Ceraceosorus bombacis]|uniref:GLYCOSIDASE CRH2-RELATED n=1 Tax=Ceraceosorus bombacis TaxID=401625 RepID=A0A0P1B9G5_9BASI|nr:GLYCOSIDASE CRH2-RELATED [Ceraceosorus bombacis]
MLLIFWALPRCKPLSISFTNKANPTVELASYNGDSSRAPLTIDSGAVRTSKSGLYATVAQKGKAKAGTTLSTTEYIQYGRVTATLRHANNKGIVGAFILMSPTADEIDFEITGGQSRQVQLNMFAQGKAFSGGDSNSATITQGPEFDTADWHAYTLDWSPTRIIYSIDGVEVRTLKRSSFKSKKDGYYKYPATPMRAQVSVWDASDMAKGTVEWAGGRADYSKADSHGTFTTQIRSLTVECHDPESLGAGSAYGFSKSIDAKSGELKVVATSRKTTI